MKLTDLVIAAIPYLSEFNYDCYPDNYRKYSEEIVPVLSNALLPGVNTAVQATTFYVVHFAESQNTRYRDSSRVLIALSASIVSRLHTAL